MAAYYNEIDPYAAAWLRNLIAAGHIAAGEVDTRSVEDVTLADLAKFTQCHFFAGLGGWSYALRVAGWPDERPVWTGSCPCQPFSQAGKGAGLADERHLWPAWHHLIGECRPAVIFGEQVAGKDALGWWDLVHADLEAAQYASGAFDLCAAGVGAAHIRQRLYWVAHPDCAGQRAGGEGREALGHGPSAGVDCGADGLGHARHDHDAGQEPTASIGKPQADRSPDIARGSSLPLGRLADTTGAGRRPEREDGDATNLAAALRAGAPEPGRSGATDSAGPLDGHWRAADWLLCRDGRWRPVEPGSQPLADGLPGRVGRLRAYGNAIVAPQAAQFVRAYMSA